MLTRAHITDPEPLQTPPQTCRVGTNAIGFVISYPLNSGEGPTMELRRTPKLVAQRARKVTRFVSSIMSNVFANDVSADLKIDIHLLFKCLHLSIQIDRATCVCMYLFKYHFLCVFVSCTLDVHVFNVSFIFGSRFRCFVLHVCTHVHLHPHQTCI